MRIILVSHGKLAKGMKNTVEMIAGKQKNIEAYEAYGNGTSDESFITTIEHSVATDKNNKVVIVTDVMGGSVNNAMIQLLKNYHNLTILTGMNLPLIITLVTTVNAQDSEDAILEAIAEGQKGVLLVNKLMSEDDEGDLL